MSLSFKEKSIVCFFVLMIFSLGIMANAQIDSPKKQMENGILPENIVCREGLHLIIRNNGAPACLKSETLKRFQDRDLGFVPKEISNLVKESNQPETPPVQFKDVNNYEDNSPSGAKVIESQNEIETIPATGGTFVNFYITDNDLNIAHSGVEIIDTLGLLEFTINGIIIDGPEKMIETGPDTGIFYAKLELPQTLNGKPISQDDVVKVKYFDQSDATGEPRVLTKSIPLRNTYAQIQSSADKTRIGHEFIIRLYEPDANLDSKDVDRIPLSNLEYRGEGGIRTSLSNPAFDANSSYLLETGENTNIFEVKIKIPRMIDGDVVGIGDWYEIRYIDKTTPSGTQEKIILQGKIG